MSFDFLKRNTKKLLPINRSNALYPYIAGNDDEIVELIANRTESSLDINNIKAILIKQGFYALFYHRLTRIYHKIQPTYLLDKSNLTHKHIKQRLNNFIEKLDFPIINTQLSDNYYQYLLTSLLDDLTELNVKPIILKGAHFSHQYYTKTWLRPKSDIDILVSHSDALLVDDYFSKKNIRAYLDMNEFHTSHFQSSYPITGPNTEPNTGKKIHLSVDVHQKLSHHPLFKNQLTYEACLSQSKSFTITKHSNQHHEQTAIGLGIVDACHHAIIHLWGHHIDEMRLIWLMDIKQIVDSMTSNEKKQWIISSNDQKILSITISTMHLIEAQFNVKVFDNTINQQLEIIENRNHSQGLAITDEPCYTLITDSDTKALYLRFKSTKGVLNKLQWLRQHVFPSAQYMKQRYQCQSYTALIMAYIKRPLFFLKNKRE